MGFQRDFVTSYLRAWNDQDADGVAGHLCSGGLYCDEPYQRQLSGEALVSHLIDYFSNERYHYELHGDVLVNANTVAFQYRVNPCGDSASNGAAAGWSGAEFIELCGTSAEVIKDYYQLADEVPRRAQSTLDGKKRYAKSGLSDAAMQQLLDGLSQAMDEDKVYLDPELSLPRLAARLHCSVNHLSQAINSGHAMSFFDYVNQYRVSEAAHMLRQKDCQFPAILDVALSVGFNSTSTFYTAFKKATGETPARYRRASMEVA